MLVSDYTAILANQLVRAHELEKKPELFETSSLVIRTELKNSELILSNLVSTPPN